MIQPAMRDFDASSSPVLAEMTIQANNPGEVIIQEEKNLSVATPVAIDVLPTDTESILLPTQTEIHDALAQRPKLGADDVGVEVMAGSLPIKEKGFMERFKDMVMGFLGATIQKDSAEEEESIAELLQMSDLKPDLPDSYVRFVAEQGAYLRVGSQEKTVRWDYLKGADQYYITRALRSLSKLKLLGHGTIGFRNTEDNHDRKISAGDVDYVGAVRLLNIILTGDIKDSSVSEFAVESKDYFKLNPNYYGPFFVILKPGIKESDLGEGNNIWNDRFKRIESSFHYMYLLPRVEDKEFFTKAIEKAVREGIINKDKAREAISKLKTVAEFLEENGERIESTNPNPVKTSPVSRQASSPLVPPKSDVKGGIDFRALPIINQAISNLSLNNSRISLSSLGKVNLDRELEEIQRLIRAGITPSTERIKEYVQISYLKGDSDMEKIVSCIADVLRLEEERCCSTEATLKDILVVLESGKSPQELKSVFVGN